MGLFQVDAEQHSCGNNARNTQANMKCLEDPERNLKYGLEILKGYYDAVSSDTVKTGDSCPDWRQLTPRERDRWRRAVSAYNGGIGWVDRAVQSVEGDVRNGRIRKRDFYRGTRDLEWGHEGRFSGRAKKSKASWEQLRVYYFLEKLMPENKAPTDKEKTGRRLQFSISNLAHVEATLGREVQGSPPGLVNFWREYARKNKPESCPAR